MKNAGGYVEVEPRAGPSEPWWRPLGPRRGVPPTPTLDRPPGSDLYISAPQIPSAKNPTGRLLASKGCTFETHKGGSGRGDRTSRLPMHGSRKELGTGLVRKILEDLGLKYRIKLTPDDNDTLLVTCSALPEVKTREDANAKAIAAIEEALAARISRGQEIPAGASPGARQPTLDDLTNEARKQARESVIITRKAAEVLAEAIRFWRTSR
jgi:mRNA interferase HicA